MLEYLLLFVLLVLPALRVPLPEESALLLAAYFAATGTDPWLLVLAAILGIACSDTLQYARGRFKSKLFKQFKPGKQLIKNAGFFAVFTARFFISSRMVLPFMAGAMQMPRLRFHVASIVSAIVLSTIVILLGGWFYILIATYFPAVALASWMVLLIVITGFLIMHATRSQMRLAKD